VCNEVLVRLNQQLGDCVESESTRSVNGMVPESARICQRRALCLRPKWEIGNSAPMASTRTGRNSPESIVSAGEVCLQVGDEETIASPIAVPNAIGTSETAEATSVPAKTAPLQERCRSSDRHNFSTL
jgi:hypothetical protein